MVAVDDMPISRSNYSNYFYAAWTDFLDISIRFNRSTDRGATYLPPVILRPQGAAGSPTSFGQGANVQTGPNGEVYVCWSDYGNVDTSVPSNTQATNIGFAKSLDGGATFAPFTRPIPCAGIRDTWGDNPLFNYTNVPGYPSMAVDKSCVNSGRIYVAFPAKENGTGKSVIQVVHSDLQGAVGSWSAPLTVSLPSAQQSWLPWISVDPGTGEISLIYYALDSPSGFSTNTYVAYSFDGGASYTNFKVSDVPHTTAAIPGWLGGLDYIGIAARGGRAFPIWADDRNGTWQLYAAPLKYYSVVGPTGICASGATTRRYVLTGNGASANYQPLGSSIAWTTSPSGFFSPATGSNPDFTTASTGVAGVGTVTATITMACGSSFTASVEVHANLACRGVATTYPNPTDKGLTLGVAQDEPSATAANERYTAQLYDQQGKLKCSLEWRGEQHQLDTSALPNGLYYLVMQGGRVNERRAIVVQH